MQTDITNEPPHRGGDAEIDFALDPEDHVACRLFLRAKAGMDIRPVVVTPPGWRPWGMFYTAAGLLALAAFLGATHAPTHLLVFVILAAIGLFFFAVTIWRHGPLQIARDPRRDVQEEVENLYKYGHVKIGRRDRVCMDAEGFTEFNEYRDGDMKVDVVERKETRVCWSEVGDIDVADQHALFHVVGKGYLFVPRRAFADGAAFQRFVETARQFRLAYIHRGQTDITLAPGDKSEALRRAR